MRSRWKSCVAQAELMFKDGGVTGIHSIVVDPCVHYRVQAAVDQWVFVQRSSECIPSCQRTGLVAARMKLGSGTSTKWSFVWL